MREYLEELRREENRKRDEREAKREFPLMCLTMFLFVAVFLVVFWFFPAAKAAELEEGWILCQPDSEVNVRARASKQSEVVGRCFLGDRVLIDRRTADWVHCVDLCCESGEGWVKASYVDEWEPEIYVQGVKAVTKAGKVNARYCIGGRVRKQLKKGVTVTVYAESEDYAVTNQGFIKPEYLERTVTSDGR